MFRIFSRQSYCQKLVVLATIFGSANAGAWSSQGYPLFESVHQMAIENVLKIAVGNSRNLEVLKQQQLVVDARDNQTAVKSYMHAMTGVVPQKKMLDFISESEGFVSSNLTNAIRSRKAGAIPAAMEALGQAIHTLEDATSPAHERFQPWKDDETWLEIAKHVAKERVYPDDGNSGYRARLEGAVRWAYDIYLEKAPMPAQFFDPATGMLRLPLSYTDHK